MLILIPHCEQIPHNDSYYYKQNQHLNLIKHVFGIIWFVNFIYI